MNFFICLFNSKPWSFKEQTGKKEKNECNVKVIKVKKKKIFFFSPSDYAMHWWKPSHQRLTE